MKYSIMLFACFSFFFCFADSQNKKILVLIIASDDKPVYVKLQQIWRYYMHLDPEHVVAYFMKSDPNLSSECEIKDDVIWVKGSETFVPGIIHKTLRALQEFLPQKDTFSYLLRTNLSSFFIFPRMLEYLKHCPKTRFYCAGDSAYPINISGFGSGCGIIVSTDLWESLVNGTSYLISQPAPDDVLLGTFIKSQGISLTVAQRMDFLDFASWIKQRTKIPPDLFHFRIKTPDQSREAADIRIHLHLLKMFYHIRPDFNLIKS